MAFYLLVVLLLVFIFIYWIQKDVIGKIEDFISEIIINSQNPLESNNSTYQGIISYEFVDKTPIISQNEYYNSLYYNETNINYETLLADKGKYGEYKVFDSLKEYQKYGGKFLFNIYVPKGNNKTTEIDILLICRKGIFVIESKNFSGEIHGKLSSFVWTEKFNKKDKYPFENPIRQNSSHIKFLKNVIKDDVRMYSLIVFSDDSKLGWCPREREDLWVVNRSLAKEKIESIMNNINCDTISQNRVEKIYEELKPYTCVSEEIKQKHIDDIRRSTLPKSTRQNISKIENSIIARSDDILRNSLIAFRKRRTNERNWGHYYYRVFNNAELENLIKYKPRTVDELRNLHILKDIKINTHGADIIKIINDFLDS